MDINFISMLNWLLYVVNVTNASKKSKYKTNSRDLDLLIMLGNGMHYDLSSEKKITKQAIITHNSDDHTMNPKKFIDDNFMEIDGITHFEVKKQPMFIEIEKEFQRLFQMKGVSYIYQRDVQWRTWRKVLDSNGNMTVVFYRCERVLTNSNNNITKRSTNGGESGFWVIEDGLPPCPYELFSVFDEDKLCGVNYKQMDDVIDACPSFIKFFDLSETCDNPIVTKWRFSEFDFAERNSSVICGKREKCEILTVYEILPSHVSFRIINSADEIIYSRIMKSGNINYACVRNCGHFDRATLRVKAFGGTHIQMEQNTSKTQKKGENKVLGIKKEHLSTTNNSLLAPKLQHDDKKQWAYFPLKTQLKNNIAKSCNDNDTGNSMSPCNKITDLQFVNEEDSNSDYTDVLY